ncbi:MAG: DUF305 domain-containing protein [Pseudonocardiales bacterium]|nr:DUF305 domain-containing protein [Pseudonocardiales bacterium]
MSTMTTFARLLAGVAVAAVALSGCAAGNPPAETPGAAPAAAPGEFTDADVAFAQGMIPHHRQAVEMAELVAGRTENPQVLDLAARIGAAQEPEIATMTAWLEEWGADVPAGSGGMSGMDHGAMDHGGMAGMMTPEQMTALEQASGPAFDRLFLEMMIEHHRGAVEMARVELGQGADPDALALAQQIIDTQQAEITEMESLLAAG